MINVGIIGTGNMAKFHLQVLTSFKDVNILALCNRTKRKAQSLADELNVNLVYDSVDDFLENDFDAIYILVSADQIFDITKKCLEKNLPLFVEKPIGLNFKEAKVLQDLDKNNLIMVGLNRRYMSTIKKAKEIMDSNGGVKTIVIQGNERWSKVKELYEKNQLYLDNWLALNGIHCIDLFTFFAGNSKNVVSSSEHGNYNALIKFENNVTGLYYSFWDCPDGWKVELLNENLKVTLKPLEKITVSNGDVFELEEIDTKYKPGFYNENKTFIEGIRNKKPFSNLASAVESMKLLSLIGDLE